MIDSKKGIGFNEVNGEIYESYDHSIRIENIDVNKAYDRWDSPTVIISDGPYGVSGFKGDLHSPDKLDKWYEPHIKNWSEKSNYQTTLWFWNTEIGWATVHPILLKYGWEYINCHVWDKGISHVAGNSNTKTLRKLPVVTEICVQYTKRALFESDGKLITVKEWLRKEWQRTGLPFSKTNDAAGVKNAASRKYFTKDHLWYSPPPQIFGKIVEYANKYGQENGRPYFSLDGKNPLNEEDWKNMKPKFKCPIGITNVWHEPPLNGKERIKNGSKSFHLNQKPLKLIEKIIKLSSDKNDLIWDPFGGLGTTAIAAHKLRRKCLTAEINPKIFFKAVERFKEQENKLY